MYFLTCEARTLTCSVSVKCTVCIPLCMLEYSCCTQAMATCFRFWLFLQIENEDFVLGFSCGPWLGFDPSAHVVPLATLLTVASALQLRLKFYQSLQVENDGEINK